MAANPEEYNTTGKILMPRSTVTELLKKVRDASTIATLSPSEPKRFADESYMVFSPSAEAEVVEEGAPKSGSEISISPITGKRIKVVTTTRISNELQWADEDNQLEIVANIIEDQTAAIARALDYVVYHAVTPKTGTALDGYTALSSTAQRVVTSGNPVDDLDEMASALLDYSIDGLALSPQYASDMRKLRVPATGQRLYPEIPLAVSATGSVDGIPAAVSGTVNGRLASEATGVLAFMGCFDNIKWGMVRDIWSEVIPYGDPDNIGSDLKGSNQVAYRTEAVLSYAVLDPESFAVLVAADDDEE